MMVGFEECYVCKKEPAKRCTSCFQIAYCSVSCQKSDWKYHKVSCLQKTVNVVDSLINLHNFEHILIKICSYLSGADLHYFGCVKRSWRDLILRIRSSEVERKLWRTKLADQWKIGQAEKRDIASYESEVSTMKISGSELFVDVHMMNEIQVFDITTGRYKFKLRAADGVVGNKSAWDVHEDFLLIYDGETIYLWDRHKHVEEEINDSVCMQLGTHYRKELNGSDHKRKRVVDKSLSDICFQLTGRSVEDDGDAVQQIKIFTDLEKDELFGIRSTENEVFVVYQSGVISKWQYFSPYKIYDCHVGASKTYEKFEFNRVWSNNYGLVFDGGNFALGRWLYYLDLNYTVLRSFELGEDWEDRIDCYSEIKEVDAIYTFFKSKTLSTGLVAKDNHEEGYLLIKRNSHAVFTEFEEWRTKYSKMKGKHTHRDPSFWHIRVNEQLVHEGDDMSFVSYLEVHAEDSYCLHLRRRMRIEHGEIWEVSMNDQHMALSVMSYFSENTVIEIYNAKEIIAERNFCNSNNIKYIDAPVPIRCIYVEKLFMPWHTLLAGVNRLIWNESILPDCDDMIGDTPTLLKSINFWMA